MKKLLWVIILIIIGFAAYWYLQGSSQNGAQVPGESTSMTEATTTAPVATNKEESVIGQSVEGRDIIAYHYGTGSDEILFIGDVHGGYSWNTALVAYKAVDYFKSNPDGIPANLKVTVIPVVNPDGLYAVVGTTTANFTAANVAPSQETQISGRFNANKVDLNRNFDCGWQPSAVWLGRTVSGGSGAFSEPESQAIKSYIESAKPKAVVAWYASAGGVFASSCNNGVLPETSELTKTYAKASGYKAYESYNFNEIPGDMVNWLAKEGIPAISVLLTNHSDVEWTKNEAGIKAVLAQYAQ